MLGEYIGIKNIMNIIMNQNIMIIKDLVEGEIYTSDINNNGTKYIYRIINKVGGYDAMLYNKTFYFNKVNIYDLFTNIKLATPEEKHWLNKCIEANKFIEYNEAIKTFKQYKGEAVNCTSEEELKFVKKTLNIDFPTWNYNKEKTCIVFNKESFTHSDLNYLKNNNFKIYSFQEWCDMFGHKPDFKPNFEIGKWYKISNNWYAKFNMIHGQNTYWQYTESITDKGRYEKMSHNLKMSDINSGLKIELLTDLSEIQEFLPDGHPDKVGDNISEYVEYIDTKYKGQIVKVEDWKCGSWCKVIFYDGTKEQPFKHLLKFSTKEAYEKQNLSKNNVNNVLLYPLTTEQCFSSEIEVGDEVKTPDGNGILIAIINSNCGYLVKNNISFGHNGYPYVYKNSLLKGNFSDKHDSRYYHLSDLKLIKKASNTTINKKDDFVSPIQVHNNVTDFSLNEKLDILDIFKPKSSKEMDFTSFKQQNPKELHKIDQQKYLTN